MDHFSFGNENLRPWAWLASGRGWLEAPVSENVTVLKTLSRSGVSFSDRLGPYCLTRIARRSSPTGLLARSGMVNHPCDFTAFCDDFKENNGPSACPPPCCTHLFISYSLLIFIEFFFCESDFLVTTSSISLD